MRNYNHPLTKGFLCLFMLLFSIGIHAQNPSQKITASAIEAGFDADIFARKPIRKFQDKTIKTYKNPQNDLVSSYNHLVEKGPKTNSMMLHETKVETYNENSYPSPIQEGYDGYKIEILHTMEPIQDNNPIFYKHGRISEEQLSDESYSYLIGDFDSAEEAAKFKEKFILTNYPDARVIHFEKGGRTE